MSFATRLLDWFADHRRVLPWRAHRTPWSVWVSETMLQQTTAEVVAQRFPQFMIRFPTVEALATATETDVLEAWAGLGYYRRARALYQGARMVMDRHQGSIPSDPQALRELPGVGPYTSGAIASLAFGVRVAAVDGNVARVAARLFAEERPFESASVRRHLGELLLEHAPLDEPGAFNEALIELGALICRPRKPLCDECPLAVDCLAFQRDRVGNFPVAKPRKQAVPVLSARLFIRRKGMVALVERPADATLLPGFLELPGGWLPEGSDPEDMLTEQLRALGLIGVVSTEPISSARHSITHHRIQSQAFSVRELRGRLRKPARWCSLEEPSRWTTETRKLLKHQPHEARG